MGTGKTTIAQLLSEKVGLPWIDTDRLIEEKMKMPVNEIFRKYGEKRFRKEEKKLLKGLKKEHNVIISCGGGLPCDDENISYMLEEGKVVWLMASIEGIVRRVAMTDERPLLSGMSKTALTSKIAKHLRERKKYYSKANIKIWNRGDPVDTVNRLINYLRKYD